MNLGTNPVARLFADSFVMLLSGNRAGLERMFKMQLSPRPKPQTVGNDWKLVLTPRVAPMDKLIKELELRGRGLNLNELTCARPAVTGRARRSPTSTSIAATAPPSRRSSSSCRANDRAQGPGRACASASRPRSRVGMIVFCALRLRVTTDITHFLPAGTDHRLAELSRRLADSSLTRTLILDVGGVGPAGGARRRRRAGGRPGGAPRGRVDRARPDARAGRVGLQAVRAAPRPTSCPTAPRRRCRRRCPMPRSTAPPARSSSRWRCRCADVLAAGARRSAPVVSRDPAPLRARARRIAGRRRRSAGHARSPPRHHLPRHAPLRVRQRRAGAAARRDPTPLRRRRTGARAAAWCCSRRASRRSPLDAERRHARRSDPDLRAVDGRGAAGAAGDVRLAARGGARVPARGRRRAGVDHGRRCCCSARCTG